MNGSGIRHFIQETNRLYTLLPRRYKVAFLLIVITAYALTIWVFTYALTEAAA